MSYIVLLLWLLAVWEYGQGRRAVLGTTLVSAWSWGLAACGLWTVAEVGSPWFPAGMTDQLWYAGCLLGLAALVAILGAKRPTEGNWVLFVVLPLLVVLGWPGGFAWSAGWPPEQIHLHFPALLACCVVAVMGLGNYVGTRLLPASLFFSGGLILQLAPLAGWEIIPGWSVDWIRRLSLICISLSILWTAWCVPWNDTRLPPWDRVWTDFINAFGIAWGRRLQERFNDMSRRSKWDVQIDSYGLRRCSAETPVATGLPEWRPEQAQHLRWLLLRFVDDAWLRERGVEITPETELRSKGEDLSPKR